MSLIQKLIITSVAFARKHLLPLVFPPPPPQLEYAPDGWNTFLGPDGSKGWNDPTTVAEESRKWDSFLTVVAGTGPLGFCHEHSDLTITRNLSFHNVHITFGYVLALAAIGKTELSVLDYGGGLGHYYHIGKALIPELKLDYHCCEVPEMEAAGRRLNPEVQWHTGNECLNKCYDLVMISGSLQYQEQWREFLHEIAQAVPVGRYLYLTRVPVVDSVDSFVAIQKSNNSRMLHWQFNREALLLAVEQAGFQAIREFVIGDSAFIENAPEQFELRGWLFQKKM